MPDLYACHCQQPGQMCPRPTTPAPDPDTDLLLNLWDAEDDRH